MKTIKIFALTLIMMSSALSAFAQKWGKTPEDSADCVTNTFL